MSKKKVLSVVLAASMIASIAAVSAVSASADDNVRGTLFFDSTGALEGAQRNTYYCYTWGSEGGAIYEWQTKETKMTKVEDNRYSFDVPKTNAAGDPVNADLVIFSGLGKGQTYDTTFSDACFGDTAYVLDEVLENPVDSAQTALACAWRNNPQEGAHIAITSTGRVQGVGILSTETPESIADNFIQQYSDGMAEGKTGYDNPDLITDEARQGYIDEINRIIAERPTAAPTTPSENPTQSTNPTDSTDPSDPTVPIEQPTQAQPAEEDPYGRIPGLPLPADVNVHAKDTNPSETYDGWDGYYNVYYFAAPSEWVSEHSDAKNKDASGNAWDIGFYWFTGSINGGDWPGVKAEKLDGKTVNIDGKDLQVYYGFAPTFAGSIIWNNGISDAVAENKQYKLQTSDIKVDDPALNNLSDKIYEDTNGEVDGVSIAGCLSYVSNIEHTTNGLTGEEMDVYNCSWKFFNPRTGEITEEALKDENGEFVTVSGEAYGYNKLAVNPYFDMNYDHVNAGEVPTSAPVATLPEAPSQVATNAQNATNATTKTNATTANQNNNASSTTSGKTVETSDSAAVVVLGAVMLAACGVVFVSRRKREM